MGYEQRRTFLNFNFFHRREKAEKEADMDPGLEKMMEVAKRERMRARMPPLEEVSKALKDFFQTKIARRSIITDNQARLAAQSLQYLLSETAKRRTQEKHEQVETPSGRPEQSRPDFLNHISLKMAARALQKLPEQADASHVQLAKLLCESVERLGGTRAKQNTAFATYVKTLVLSGRTSEAKAAFEEFEGRYPQANVTYQRSDLESDLVEDGEEVEDLSAVEPEESSSTSPIGGYAWMLILKGFVREGNEAEALRTLAILQDRGLGDRPGVSLIMAQLSLQRDDLAGIREWWDQFRQTSAHDSLTSSEESVSVLREILAWGLQQNELDFGHAVVKDLMKTNPPKVLWDTVFVWAAGTGKGVDEIDRMISVMEKSNDTIADESHWRIADIRTINALVEFAVRRKDPYMAERFISMGQRRNIQPDARTYVLQMQYRLSVDDVDGALIAYKSMQPMDLSSKEDLPTVNKLIVALCKSQRHDFDTIMNVTADLSDRRATFEAETVAVLSLIHLNRDEHNDVLDLLNTHAYHYSTADRTMIRDALLANSLDSKTPTARAWNGYLIIHDLFDETPRPQRTELMTAFMGRGRADMGVRIFQHMRAHSRGDTMPTIDTYVAAFLGLAKIRELESLDVVHNQLKLDFNVVATTYCYNALMLAYIACGDAEAGLKFWGNIIASKEGPSYNSIHIALRACEKTAFGDLKAREIWSLLRRRNVDLDHNLWCSYLAALCGNGNVDQALNAAEEAEEKGEVVVDEFLIGGLCDSTPKYAEKQAMIEEWALDRYPEVWKRLQVDVGFETLETGTRRYRVDRRVSP